MSPGVGGERFFLLHERTRETFHGCPWRVVYDIDFSKGVPGEERLADDARLAVSSRLPQEVERSDDRNDKAWSRRRQRFSILNNVVGLEGRNVRLESSL